MRRSMVVLRRNLGIFVYKFRMRHKARSAPPPPAATPPLHCLVRPSSARAPFPTHSPRPIHLRCPPPPPPPPPRARNLPTVVKVRSADVLREFIGACAKKAGVARTIKNFIYKSIFVQRLWRTYRQILNSQLGILVLQFDKLVRTKKTVDQRVKNAACSA